jgi:uncharacterized OB-fold protein
MTLNIKSCLIDLMPMEEKSIGMQDTDKDIDKISVKYCVECGAKMPGSQKVCPACGESQ